jgi:hypothetical protein
VRSPLWREGGSVICTGCWPLPAKSFSGPSPLGLATIFYCLRFETSLFVASYDSIASCPFITLRHAPNRKRNLYCWRGVFTAPLPSNIRPTVDRIGSRGNVFTESLPSNGHTRHNIYREFNFVDQITVLRITATGAPPAARRVRVLPMNQHATFRMKESNLWTAWWHYVSRRAMRFVCGNFFYDLSAVGNSYQLN